MGGRRVHIPPNESTQHWTGLDGCVQKKKKKRKRKYEQENKLASPKGTFEISLTKPRWGKRKLRRRIYPPFIRPRPRPPFALVFPYSCGPDMPIPLGGHIFQKLEIRRRRRRRFAVSAARDGRGTDGGGIADGRGREKKPHCLSSSLLFLFLKHPPSSYSRYLCHGQPQQPYYFVSHPRLSVSIPAPRKKGHEFFKAPFQLLLAAFFTDGVLKRSKLEDKKKKKMPSLSISSSNPWLDLLSLSCKEAPTEIPPPPSERGPSSKFSLGRRGEGCRSL